MTPFGSGPGTPPGGAVCHPDACGASVKHPRPSGLAHRYGEHASPGKAVKGKARAHGQPDRVPENWCSGNVRVTRPPPPFPPGDRCSPKHTPSAQSCEVVSPSCWNDFSMATSILCKWHQLPTQTTMERYVYRHHRQGAPTANTRGTGFGNTSFWLCRSAGSGRREVEHSGGGRRARTARRGSVCGRRRPTAHAGKMPRVVRSHTTHVLPGRDAAPIVRRNSVRQPSRCF